MLNPNTRAAIVEAADDLFYRLGFEHTSFADIADVVSISRGNFYHHFKSKDDILDAVIEKRLADRIDMLRRWELTGATPEARINSFIDILLVNGEKIKQYGCPIGTLRNELAKLNHRAQDEASGLFTLFRTWICRQFAAAGCPAPDTLAMHLLARTQGVATLATAFKDEDFVRREVADMHDWTRTVIAEANGSPS